MKKFTISIFVTLILLVSCSTKAQNDTKDEVTKEAQGNVFLVLSPEEFDAKLDMETHPQLIDVRTASEFNQGSIPNAQNFDILDGTFQKRLKTLDKTKPVFVFCAKGGRSGKASNILKESGFTSVLDLKGGYTAWRSSHP